MTARAGLAVACMVVVAAACSPDIPEPETAAARLYIERCNGCHRLFAPGTLTAAMWDMQVERMQGELVRRGIPPLTRDERQVLLAYLHRHSADAEPTAKDH